MPPNVRFINENSIGLHEILQDPKKLAEWLHDFKLKYPHPSLVRALGLNDNDLTDDDLVRLFIDLELSRFVNLRFIELNYNKITKLDLLLSLPSKPAIQILHCGIRRASVMFHEMMSRGVDLEQCDRIIFLSKSYYPQVAANESV